MRRAATISEDGVYRYRLDREWHAGLPTLAWVMLNPSTADAEQDDPTIKRCIGFARDSGYGGIVVVNLFALRATDPQELDRHTDPIGPENPRVLHEVVSAHQTAAAWGAHVGVMDAEARHAVSRIAELLTAPGATLFPPVLCLGTTKDGHPRHPLYMKADAVLVPFELEPTPASTVEREAESG